MRFFSGRATVATAVGSLVVALLLPLSLAEATVEPTVEPTAEPTVSPTAEPTVSPTAEPTVSPTVEPTVSPTVEPEPLPDPRTNPITAENRNPGSAGWRIPAAGKTLADDVGQQVKGYFSATSVEVGSSIDLHLRSTTSATVEYDIYRLGWYGGTGGRLMMQSGPLPVDAQENCLPQAVTGLIECDWSVADTIDVPTTWVSGIYIAVLTAGVHQNYATFTVRDGRQDALLAVQPVHTHQAYNNFPRDGRNGKSLYTSSSYGFTTVQGTAAAVEVSFERPYAAAGSSRVLRDDQPFVFYAESRGFDVTYATDTDYHARPEIARGQRAVIFMGHAEYWTWDMRETVVEARSAGQHLSFFGANNVYWHVRLESSARGVPHRTIVCYKVAGIDPVADKSQETLQFRQLGYPEQELQGQQYSSPAGLPSGDHDWVVTAANSWFYRGTGLRNGQSIPDLVGIETDFRQSGVPMPAMSQHFVLAQSPTTSYYGGPGVHEAALYRAPSGSWVFAAGAISYARGLGAPDYVDRRTQAMTTNLLTRQLSGELRVSTSRIGGADRYETAALISRETFGAGVRRVYLATGLKFPDAVAASAATGGEVPILLTRPSALPGSTLEELRRLDPAEVVVLGDVDAVSAEVAELVAAETGAAVTRIFGRDRYETAAGISAEAFQPGVETAYVATGANFPDALAAGAAGAQNGSPVVLTATTSLSTEARSELIRLAPARIVVVGSASAVSDGVAAELSTIAPVVRLGGSNRYETAHQVFRDVVSADVVDDVVMATGLDFPDALTGGPMVAALGGALVLTRTTLDAQDAEEVVRNDPGRVIFLGSEEGRLTSAIASATKRLFDVADGVTTTAPTDPTPPIFTRSTSAVASLDEDVSAPTLADELPWLAPE